MNIKEVSEIRRCFRPDKCNIERIRGCYVNDQREIVSEFNQPLISMSQKESEELLAILKKTLSGTIGKNLIDIEFATQQVVNSEEHKLLMSIRNCPADDDTICNGFFKKVIETLNMEGSYLILLAFNKYDVPFYTKDGNKQDDSSEIFSSFLCSICPIKQTKPALGYDIPENTFRNISIDWVVSAPELGFMFPTFDDRTTNIYNALYYTKSTTESHLEFVDTIFKTEIPMPAAEQKETFETILSNSIADDCSIDVMQEIHSQISNLIEEHKESKDDEPLEISKKTVEGVLTSCGVSETHVSAFEKSYDDEFGADTMISPKNIIDTNKFEVKTPDVSIKVNPERSDLLETRIINGAKYILIRADGGVEVNGVNITISE